VLRIFHQEGNDVTTIEEISRYVTALTGHGLNRDEGVQHGAAERRVHGVTVAWMATPDAIRAAGEAGHELLIGHESLYFPYDVVTMEAPPEGWEDWQVNRQRREGLARYGLSFLRLHGSVDEICIFDTFAEMLELGEPVYVEGLVKVYEISSCTLGELVERVKARVGMAAVRVAPVGGMERRVSRVGLPWGGLGLFVNVGYQQQLIAQGCDVFVAGESDNYGFRFAAECGIPMIETSHEVSENQGLARFTELLAAEFPEVRWRFWEEGCVWRVV
jgi:putative NIF3 family GTP cyclohydrolase 1 type 2